MRSPYQSMSFGPGPLTPAVRLLIGINVGLFIVTALWPQLSLWLGLVPASVVQQGAVWRLMTYAFLHFDLMHLLFNMLGLWMFGVELERLWGTSRFTTYYLVCAVGAALTTLVVSLLPFDATRPVYYTNTIGASGAIYGLLFAWGRLFPTRQILMFLLFPVPARVFVVIMGAATLWSAMTASGSGVAHITHLGGFVAGWLYLISRGGGGGGLTAEVKYRYLKWKMARMRRNFEVVSGGGGRWNGKH